MNKKERIEKAKRNFKLSFLFVFLCTGAFLFYILKKSDQLKDFKLIPEWRIIPYGQEELGRKLLAMQKDGKIYNLGIWGSDVAFDEDNDHLYGRMPWFNIEDFIALMYNDYTVRDSPNPFLDSVILFNSDRYVKNEIKYLSALEQMKVETYFNNEGQEIFRYQENKKGQAFIKKLYPKFYGSRRRSGSLEKDDYIDITEFIQAKFNKKISFTIDEEKKLCIIQF